MKAGFAISYIFFIKFSLAQSFLPSVRELVDAENAFASQAKNQNTRDAFVTHLADNGIVFEKANPVFGREVWMKKKADSSLLFWWPVFSDISASGDFGYNTGPFEWSADRKGAKPVAFGYFSSVWRKGENNNWKVVIDMGMGLPSEEDSAPSFKTSKTKPVEVKDKMLFYEAREELLARDRTYVDQLNKRMTSFILHYLSDEVRIHRTGHFPVVSKDMLNSFVDSRDHYHFQHLGGDMASSADLAYTYGRVDTFTKSDKKLATFNYLRIWKKEDGENWVIVLDVIGG
jgi:ketosteroid isomerase-like protein